jgi:hypothetical protein
MRLVVVARLRRVLPAAWFEHLRKFCARARIILGLLMRRRARA